MTKTEKFVSELKANGEQFKQVKIFVPEVGEVDFILLLYIDPKSNTTEIDEYIYGLDGTLEEMDQINFWVSELGGANKVAKLVGLVDTHYTIN
jgi:hypothetical protein